MKELVKETRETIKNDCLSLGGRADSISLNDGGRSTAAYADLIALVLAFVVDRCTDFNNSLCRWTSANEKVMSLFVDRPCRWYGISLKQICWATASALG